MLTVLRISTEGSEQLSPCSRLGFSLNNLTCWCYMAGLSDGKRVNPLHTLYDFEVPVVKGGSLIHDPAYPISLPTSPINYYSWPWLSLFLPFISPPHHHAEGGVCNQTNHDSNHFLLSSFSLLFSFLVRGENRRSRYYYSVHMSVERRVFTSRN